MSEYIITDKQLKTATEAYLEHELSRPITAVFISGDKLPEIVRCRDCRWLDHHNLYLCMLPDGDGGYACWVVEPDGFCKWGEPRGEGEGE